MSNLFDTLQNTALNIVNNTMGYDASWIPLAGGGPYTARVLLNRPTKKDTINQDDYDAISIYIECKECDLPGLFESVRANNTEQITVNGILYNCFRAEKKYDGVTVVIDIEPIE